MIWVTTDESVIIVFVNMLEQSYNIDRKACWRYLFILQAK